MREIKFRAWSKTKNQMVSWNQIIHSTSYNLYGGLWEIFKRHDTHVPMEYTGLKDKNGKEIYEGDIVALDGGGEKIPKCEVIFEYGCWCIKADWLDQDNHSNPELKYYTVFHELEDNKAFKDCLLVEVIGNIYEHPELIKTTNVPAIN
jgi:uncharacterized phage protein (TIGR01671 family)